jgi:hypothetical protein
MASPLKLSLFGPGHRNSENLADALLSGIWGLPPSSRDRNSNLLAFYFAQVSIIDEYELAVKTHQDVVDLVAYLQQRLVSTIREVRAQIALDQPQWLGQSQSTDRCSCQPCNQHWLSN